MPGMNGGRWGKWSELLAGLPYDVQAIMSARLRFYNLDPAQCYRLPLLVTTPRMTVAAGGTAQSSIQLTSLSAIWGLSQSFDNETGGTVSAATLVYPSELSLQVQLNNGATTWLGSTSEPCRMSAIGDSDHVTRVDPVAGNQNDVWNISVTGDATLANTVFSTVHFHGCKFFNASGAI